ncbi:DUF465 domain-containing protein [Maritalea sp. P4.10X]|uniref:DUF465 domain-containing protein n=1 Tax=Maritalea mediterranea TaxID=2909667 RepID=A0ABS9E9U5_9HYPH|nr:DUF465 domain-containing protein [Maritalea mediterranea]MCF4099638.1 DUF465 domain-containing protein [Maritalea mediterranea]
MHLTTEQQAKMGTELAAKRQEHKDLDASINALMATGCKDAMMLQRLKKKKLAIKDRIIYLEQFVLPDIIA